MQNACHYTLLGIGFDASSEEIAAAYAGALARFKRRLAAGRPLPLEQLDALRVAHRTLSEPAARAAYDRARGYVAAPAARAASALPAARQQHSGETETAVEFHGTGAEYLRIWLVNVALSVLTLGIYSAWAKVRREKYFHRNLMVDGAAFDYHGNPRAILIGRILLVALLVVMNFADGAGPVAHTAASIAAMFAFPWLLVRALQFRARNTSYRGIRFAFVGSYRSALILYLVHGGLTLVTAGLYFPAFLRKQKEFLANHLQFGGNACRFDAGVAAFYRGLKVPLLLWLLLPLSVAATALLFSGKPGNNAMLAAMLLPLLIALLVLLLNLLLVPYVRVVGTNLLWNHTTLGETRFRSTQTVRGYLNLIVGNWLLTLLSLGFYWPVAQVRVARYRAEHLGVVNAAALGEAVAAANDSPAALGDEVVDAFDFDIAL